MQSKEKKKNQTLLVEIKHHIKESLVEIKHHIKESQMCKRKKRPNQKGRKKGDVK